MSQLELSPTNENYLKVVWAAQEWSDRPVTTKLLASHLGLSPSTVSEAVKRLTDQGLVEHAPYGAIELTGAGRRAAVTIVRRHRLIETFLVRELGYAWDEVHDEAEVLEHAVSERLVNAIDARLGFPPRDPHGDPIPGVDGEVVTVDAQPLSRVEVGRALSIARISDSDPELLRYLAGLRIDLDTGLVVTERRDFAGTLTVLVDGGVEPVTLGLPAADVIWVVGRDEG